MVAGRFQIGCVTVAGRSPVGCVLVVGRSYHNVTSQRHHDQNVTPLWFLDLECVLNSVKCLHTPKIASSVEACRSCLKSHI